MSGGSSQRFFRVLNRVVEPAVERGVFSTPLALSTLLLVEHVGRRSGRTYRTPLVATRTGAGWCVSTVRGHRSQWLKNLARMDETRFWLGGRARRARVWTALPGAWPGALPRPAAARVTAAALSPWARAGLGLALLRPLPPAPCSDQAGWDFSFRRSMPRALRT